MIRDPSDGSVREAPKAEAVIPATKPDIGIPISPDTGLRQPTRTGAQLRLERSREWLKDYHAKQGVSHADGGSDDQRTASELPDRAGG